MKHDKFSFALLVYVLSIFIFLIVVLSTLNKEDQQKSEAEIGSSRWKILICEEDELSCEDEGASFPSKEECSFLVKEMKKLQPTIKRFCREE